MLLKSFWTSYLQMKLYSRIELVDEREDQKVYIAETRHFHRKIQPKPNHEIKESLKGKHFSHILLWSFAVEQFRWCNFKLRAPKLLDFAASRAENKQRNSLLTLSKIFLWWTLILLKNIKAKPVVCNAM